jgi:rhodanese-related sulfurtransferase
MQFRNKALSLAAVLLLIMGSAYAQDAKSDKASAAKKNQMSAKELKERLDKGDKVIIVDARHNLNGQIIKNAVHVPTDNLAEWAKSIDKNAVIVTYCTCPHDEAAEKEVKDLLGMGFVNAYSLMGGLDAARNAGIDVVAPKE